MEMRLKSESQEDGKRPINIFRKAKDLLGFTKDEERWFKAGESAEYPEDIMSHEVKEAYEAKQPNAEIYTGDSTSTVELVQGKVMELKREEEERQADSFTKGEKDWFKGGENVDYPEDIMSHEVKEAYEPKKVNKELDPEHKETRENRPRKIA